MPLELPGGIDAAAAPTGAVGASDEPAADGGPAHEDLVRIRRRGVGTDLPPNA